MTVLRTLGHAPLSARLGLGLIAVYLGAALLAPLLAPYGETEVVGDVWEASSRSALLGTDQLGRDLVSRLLYGARNTVGVALAATLLAFVLGVVGGSAAALIGGWVDSLLNWLVEVLLALPSLILALLLLSVLSPSVTTIILVSALLSATRVFRLARALALGYDGGGVCRAGQAARGGLVVGRSLRDCAEHVWAAAGRTRPAVLLCVPVHQLAQFSGSGPAAANG